MKNLNTVFTTPKNGNPEINIVDDLQLNNTDPLGNLRKDCSSGILIPVKPWVAPVPQKLYGVLEVDA
jgi:hypothetical protein